MLDLFRYLLENFSGRLEVRSEKNQVNQPVHPPSQKKLCPERPWSEHELWLVTLLCEQLYCFYLIVSIAVNQFRHCRNAIFFYITHSLYNVWTVVHADHGIAIYPRYFFSIPACLARPGFAAAVYFNSGKVGVLSCRFLDNKAGTNPYTAVATMPLSLNVFLKFGRHKYRQIYYVH